MGQIATQDNFNSKKNEADANPYGIDPVAFQKSLDDALNAYPDIDDLFAADPAMYDQKYIETERGGFMEALKKLIRFRRGDG